jgi:hypothetical protein
MSRWVYLLGLGLALVALGFGLPKALFWQSEAPARLLCPEPAPLPGGLADQAGKRGFFANPVGGIDAVDLETGKLLWQSQAASRPLLLLGDQLFVQTRTARNQIRITVLDCSRRGERVRQSDPITFLSPQDTQKAKQILFHAKAHLEGGRLRLQWEAITWFRNKKGLSTVGYRPGVALIDLGTGRVEMLPKKALSIPSGPSLDHVPEILRVAAAPYRLPPADIAALQLPAQLDRPTGLQHGHRSLWQSWFTGKVIALLVEEVDFESHALLLLRWDRRTGHYLGTARLKTGFSMTGGVPRPVFCGHGLYLLFYPSLEEYFRRLEENVRRGWGKEMAAGDSPVEVFAVEEGRWSGRITLEAGAKEPLAAGPRLFYTIEGEPQGPPEDRVIARANRIKLPPNCSRAVDFVKGSGLRFSPE